MVQVNTMIPDDKSSDRNLEIGELNLWVRVLLGHRAKVWASHLWLWQAGSYRPARAKLCDSLHSPGVAACNAYDPARRYLTVGHCPKSLDRLSNLTSAQKKAKKHLKEARSEAQTAVLQRFWVKSAIGRIIGRDCS